MDTDFWKGKKVAIAGGASFIASHTAERLLELGVLSVWGVDDLSSGSWDNLESSDIKCSLGDLKDYENALYLTHDADIVLDFASVHGGRGFVGTNHEVAISDNFILNTNILRAAVEN